MNPRVGLGLACGFNDLVAVDVDNEKAFPTTREVFSGIHPPSKVGRKGATAFFRGEGVESRKFCEPPAVDPATGKTRRPVLVEILAAGNQTVIPPTKHPDTGKPYRWIYGSLEDIGHVSELPVLTQAKRDELAQALAPLMPAKLEKISLKIEPKISAANISHLERKRYEGFALAALRSETDDLAHCAKPGRNRALFRATCSLGKYVTHGVLPANQLVESLKLACQQNGLIKDNGLKDVMRTLEKGLVLSAKDPLPVLTERERFAARR
jgi:hypothetical protein